MDRPELRVTLNGEVISQQPITGDSFTLPGKRKFSLKKYVQGTRVEYEYASEKPMTHNEPRSPFNFNHPEAGLYKGSTFEIMSCGALSWEVTYKKT